MYKRLSLILVLLSFSLNAVAESSAEFRAFYASEVSAHVNKEGVPAFIYSPSQKALSSQGVDRTSPEAFFKGLEAQFQSLDAYAFYRQSLQEPVAQGNVSRVDEILKSQRSPLTVIIVPGVLGEFIKTRAFEDVFSRNGTYYESHVKNRFARSSFAALKVDKRFDMNAFREVDRPLLDLIHTASIDDVDGNPLVNLILLDVGLLSLESMGKNRDRAQVFNRRLTKFFKVVGVPPHIAMIGYSRGTPLALEMISQASSSGLNWFKKVRAVGGLGGVIYGSDLADEALNEKKRDVPFVQYQQLKLLMELSQSLELLSESNRPDFITKSKNALAWARFISGMVKLNAPEVELDLNVDLSVLKSRAEEVFQNLSTMSVLNVSGLWQAGKQMALESFRLDQFDPQYDLNIRRWKFFVRAIADAVSELTTSARLDWWRNNTIPTAGITYYSITGSMVDPSIDRDHKDLAENKYSYNASLYDYILLGKSFADLKRSNGVSLNDSQVAVFKARFWPEIHEVLNPAQKPINAKFLGVLGVDHWGMALRVVNEKKNGAENPYSPFPRESLLKTYAAQMVSDLR